MGSRKKMRLSVILLFALTGIVAAFPQAGDGKENAVAQEKDEDSPKETVFADDGQDDTDKEGESNDGATAAFPQAGDDKENTVSQEKDEKSRQEITPTDDDQDDIDEEGESSDVAAAHKGSGKNHSEKIDGKKNSEKKSEKKDEKKGGKKGKKKSGK